MPGVQVRLGMKKQKLVDLKSFWHVECCSCAGSDQKNLIEQLIGEVQEQTRSNCSPSRSTYIVTRNSWPPKFVARHKGILVDRDP